MSYSVETIARYILEKTGTINTMKLQNLAYYCQAWSLAWDDKPLIKENFQAWNFGPTCVKLEKLLGDKYIASIDDFADKKETLDEDAIETMDAIIDSYGELEGMELSQISHRQKPWIEARAGLSIEIRGNRVISKKTMAEFHREQQSQL